MSNNSFAAPAPLPFTNVFVSPEPERTITYRTGLVVYQEGLVDGQFVSLGLERIRGDELGA
jgi:hypothetical protein